MLCQRKVTRRYRLMLSGEFNGLLWKQCGHRSMVLIDRKRRLSGWFYERVVVNEEHLLGPGAVELELRFTHAESPVADLGSVQGPVSSFHSGSVAPHCFHSTLPSMFTTAACSRSSQLHLVSSISCTWPHFKSSRIGIGTASFPWF